MSKHLEISIVISRKFTPANNTRFTVLDVIMFHIVLYYAFGKINLYNFVRCEGNENTNLSDKHLKYVLMLFVLEHLYMN